MLETLKTEPYSPEPHTELYHYTNLDALLSIAESKKIWTTEVRFLNDYEELQNFYPLAANQAERITQFGKEAQNAHSQFSRWLSQQFGSLRRLMFVGCFTEEGNLLSQWRGYCSYGCGVSIGFRPGRIVAAAREQNYLIGRCVYENEQKSNIAADILEAVLEFCVDRGPETECHPSYTYDRVFEEIEPLLFSIAAFMKHDALREEHEWRIVSEPFNLFSSVESIKTPHQKNSWVVFGNG